MQRQCRFSQEDGYDNRKHEQRRIGMNRIQNIKQRLHWLRRGLNSVLFEKPMPSAMVSWRLLFPTADPCICAHRAFWRHATSPRLPLLAAIAIESFLWLRWVCWYAWISTRAWVQECGPDLVASGGPGYWQQYFAVLRLALLHTIHPSDAYAYQLFRKDQHDQMWRYVYSQEAQAYHQWCSVQQRSIRRADWLAATELLSDKVALTRHLQQLDLPAAEILEVVPQGSRPDFAHWLAHYPALFCKTRRGARAEGAFVVERSDNATGFSLKMFRGNQPDKADAASQLRTLLDNSEYLVQRRLENHPQLAPLAAPGELVELRVITACDGKQAAIHSAFLHMAVCGKNSGHDWLFFPVSPASGSVLAPPAGVIPQRYCDYSATVLTALHNQPLPDWPVISEVVLKAHQGVLHGAATIAWDIVMTPDGARILEGNSGWGLITTQMLNGPLLPVS